MWRVVLEKLNQLVHQLWSYVILEYILDVGIHILHIKYILINTYISIFWIAMIQIHIKYNYAPILQMKKLMFRVINTFTYGRTVYRWQNWIYPYSLLKTMLLT